jgi:hypothetical protein
VFSPALEAITDVRIAHRQVSGNARYRIVFVALFAQVFE